HETIDEKDIGRLARASIRLQKIRKITSNSLFCWSFLIESGRTAWDDMVHLAEHDGMSKNLIMNS
ncbi:hypothetical protein, partial [Prevotella corporis]|uniref:hypothetical protein n=1 Tax=Prevotella corporis TaxID=28128 RepID=UPI0023F00D8C